MGIRNTLRNNHRKRPQVGGARPARDFSGIHGALGETVNVAEAERTNRLRKAQETSNRAAADKAARLSQAEKVAARKAAENIRVPEHPETVLDSLAKRRKQELDDEIAERDAILLKNKDEINTRANLEINAENEKIAKLTAESRAAEDALKSKYVDVNPTPRQISENYALRASANARTQAMKQATNNLKARLTELNAKRDAALNQVTQSAKIEKAIYGWVKIASNMRVIGPILRAASEASVSKRASGFLYIPDATNRVVNRRGLANDASEATKSAQRVVTNAVLLQTANPIKVSTEIHSRETLIAKLTADDVNLGKQIEALQKNIKGRADALPSLLDRARLLQSDHATAVRDLNALRVQRDGLTPPTDGRDALTEQIAAADKAVQDIVGKLSNIGNDIIASLTARDYLIAKKAEAEKQVLDDLTRNITGTEPQLTNSKNDLEAARRMNDTITTALSDIATAVKPFQDESTALKQLVLNIAARNLKDSGTLIDQGRLLNQKGGELIGAIQLLSDTITQNRIDAAHLTTINDSINQLLNARASHEALYADILAALQKAHELEGGLSKLNPDNIAALAAAIQAHLKNDVGPALIDAGKADDAALIAFENADTALTTTTSDINIKRDAINGIFLLRDSLLKSISQRSANIRKVIHDSNQSAAKDAAAAAATDSMNARGQADAIKVGIKLKVQDATADALLLSKLAEERETLAGRISDTGDISIALVDATRAEGDAASAASNALSQERFIRDVLLPPVDTNIGAEQGQLSNLSVNLADLGTAPVKPVFLEPIKPASSEADRATLKGLTIPDVVDGRPAAIAARAKAESTATSLLNSTDAGATLNSLSAEAATIKSGLDIQETTLSNTNTEVVGVRDANTRAYAKLGDDINTFNGMTLIDKPTSPDSSLVDALRAAVPVRESEVPPYQDPPSQTSAAIEAGIKAIQLPRDLQAALDGISKYKIRPPNADPTDVNNLIGEVSREEGYVNRLFQDMQSRDPSAAQKALEAQQALKGILERGHENALINKATLEQSLADLGQLYSTRENREAQQINASSGSETASSGRATAKGLRQAAESGLLTKADPTAIKASLADAGSLVSDLAGLHSRRDAASTAKEDADTAIANIDLTTDIKNTLIADSLVSSNRDLLKSVNERIVTEEGQRSKIADDLSNAVKPEDPTAVDDPRPPIADNAAAAAEDARRAAQELANMVVPPSPSRADIDTAIAAKETARISATTFSNEPATALKNTKEIAISIEGGLKIQDGALTTANESVRSAENKNRITREKLASDQRTLGEKGTALNDAKATRELAKDAVDDIDALDASITNSLDNISSDLLALDPVQEPVHEPPPRDPVALASELGEVGAAVYTTRRQKEDNEVDIDALDDSIRNSLDNISSDLLAIDTDGLTVATTHSTDTSNALTDAIKRLTDASTSHDNVKQSYKDLNTYLRDLNEELTVRNNIAKAIADNTRTRENYKILRDNLKALRDGMVRTPIGDKADSANTIKLVDDAMKNLSEKIGDRDALRDVAIPDIEALRRQAELDKSAADIALEDTLNLRDFFGYDFTPEITREGSQRDTLELELATDPPPTPSLPVDGREAVAAALRDAAADAAAAGAELAKLRDPGAPDHAPVDSANAAKAKAETDAQALRQGEAEAALARAKGDKESLNRDLKYALGQLEAAVRDVKTAGDENNSSLDALRKAEITAAAQQRDIVALKYIIGKYNDSIDEATRIIKNTKLNDVPPHQDPPQRGPLLADLSSELARIKGNLDYAAGQREKIFTLIKRLNDDVAGLNDDIGHALDRVSDIFASMDNTDLLNAAANLIAAKSNRDTLNDLALTGLNRVVYLKGLKYALESYKDVLINRNIRRLEAQGQSRALAAERRAAKLARDAADSAAKLAEKQSIADKEARINELMKEIEIKRSQRDDDAENNHDADLEILNIENELRALMDSVFGKKIQELDNARRQVELYAKKKKEVEDDMARLLKEIEDATKKYGKDSDEVRRLEDELARRKRLRDELEARRKSNEDEIAKLKKELELHKKLLADLDAANARLKREKETRASNNMNLQLSGLMSVGGIAAGLAAAAASAYVISGLLGPSNTRNNDSADDGTADGKRDGTTAGETDGAGSAAGQAYAQKATRSDTQDLGVGEPEVEAEAEAEAEPEEEAEPEAEAEPEEEDDSETTITQNVNLSGGANNIDETATNTDETANNTDETTTNTDETANNTDETTTNIDETTTNIDETTEAAVTELPETPEVPETPTPLQIGIDEIPEPTNIPFDTSKFIGKSGNYVSTYKIAFTDAYTNAYKMEFQNAVENYRGSNLKPVSAADQIPGETYHIQSDKYGVDGDYVLDLQNTGEYYKFEPDNKTVIVLADDADSIAIYRVDEAENTNSENAAYLQYTSLDNSSKLVVLAADIDSGDVIVTAVDDVEPTTTDDTPETDEEVEPTF